MRKKTDIKIRCNDIEQQLKEWGKVPTNSEDTNLLQIMLGAPEASSGKIYLLQILFFHFYPFYVLLCVCPT